jgi:twitching motility protein PilT
MGRVPAVEVMVNSGAIKEAIMDPEKTITIPELMEAGTVQYGMQSFDQSIMKLYKEGMISFEEAIAQATNPDDFDLRVKGITGTSDRWESEDKEGDKASKQSGHEMPSGMSKY